MPLSLLILALQAGPAGGAWDLAQSIRGGVADHRLGYGVAAGADLDGDGHADYAMTHSSTGVITLPNSAIYFVSGQSNELLATHEIPSAPDDFGRAMQFIGDLNGDGIADLAAGFREGVLLLSGADGMVIREITPPAGAGEFGWSLAVVADADGDGLQDLAVGAPRTRRPNGDRWGAVYLVSSATGLDIWANSAGVGEPVFGEVVLETDDYDLDGRPDLLVSARGHDSAVGLNVGAAIVVSSATGAELARYESQTPGAQFGSAMTLLDDMDGDGFREFAWSSLFPERVSVWSTRVNAPIYTLDPPNLADYHSFGDSLTIVPDIDGDGFRDLGIGDPNANPIFDSNRWGSIRLVSSATGALIQELIGEWFDSLGESVAVLEMVVTFSLITGHAQASDRGAVRRYDVMPCMSADQSELSVSAGGTLTLELDFPPMARELEYRILLSESGTGPVKAGVWIPLTDDALFQQSVAGTLKGYVEKDLVGTLGLQGDRTVVIDLAPSFAPGLVGRTLYFAAVAGEPGQNPLYSSMAASVLFTP